MKGGQFALAIASVQAHNHIVNNRTWFRSTPLGCTIAFFEQSTHLDSRDPPPFRCVCPPFLAQSLTNNGNRSRASLCCSAERTVLLRLQVAVARLLPLQLLQCISVSSPVP